MSGLVIEADLRGKVEALEERLLVQRDNFLGQISGLQVMLGERDGVIAGLRESAGEGSAPGLSLEVVQGAISGVCGELEAMLLGKNRAYGNSALEPLRVFSRASAVEQLNVRLDDKLSRVMRGEAAGEDVEWDLLGYLVLKRVARRLGIGGETTGGTGSGEGLATEGAESTEGVGRDD